MPSQRWGLLLLAILKGLCLSQEHREGEPSHPLHWLWSEALYSQDRGSAPHGRLGGALRLEVVYRTGHEGQSLARGLRAAPEPLPSGRLGWGAPTVWGAEGLPARLSCCNLAQGTHKRAGS